MGQGNGLKRLGWVTDSWTSLWSINYCLYLTKNFKASHYFKLYSYWFITWLRTISLNTMAALLVFMKVLSVYFLTNELKSNTIFEDSLLAVVLAYHIWSWYKEMKTLPSMLVWAWTNILRGCFRASTISRIDRKSSFTSEKWLYKVLPPS